MSKADKMFYDLGYTMVEKEEGVFVYTLKIWCIVIDSTWKEYYSHDYLGDENKVGDMVSIGLEEHLAIHEKMKELGWLDV